MKFSIMYDIEGNITGTTLGQSAPLDEDLPSGISQIILDSHVQTLGKRVDLSSLTVVDCPVYARVQHNNNIQAQLDAIDRQRHPRAVSELLLTGDKSSLQKVEADKNELRAKFI